MTRRTLLASAGAALLSGLVAPGRLLASGAAASPLELTAGPARALLLPQGEPETALWGYNGMVPGPLLRVRQGQELAVEVKNGLEQPTAVHWHGIRIDNAMDGVAGLTQEAIAPGASFSYRFTPPDAGTYWYHSHNRSWEQMARGLYGFLIVEEEEPLAVDREMPIAVDDWRLDEAGAIDEASLGSLHDAAHGGRLGNVLTLNSQDYLESRVQRGERIRVRLCNMANARIMALEFTGHSPWLIALDGQPVTPRQQDEPVVLAPGQRADLILDARGPAGSRHPILAHTGRQSLEVGSLNYSAEELRDPDALGPVPSLPDNGLAQPELSGASRYDLVMQGGAMGRMAAARLGGEELGPRALAERGFVWSFNGVAGRPEEPWFRAKRGESVVARLVNDTAWPHVIHSHGHHFLILEEDGGLPSDRQWRDGVLLNPQEERTIAFVADNPGKWLLHCHMLEHQSAGMVTWFEVA